MTVSQRSTTIVGLFVVFMGISSGNLSALEDGRMPQANTPESVDVVQVMMQVCVPNVHVDFEDVEVDLKGIPEAKTLAEFREANGIHENKKGVEPTVGSQGEIDTVRKWMPSSGEGQVKNWWIGFQAVLNRDGLLSALSGAEPIVDSTESNQPIYGPQTLRQKKEYIAVAVSVEESGEGLVKYWFKLPGNIPADVFTDWQAPISREGKAEREKQRSPTFLDLTHGREMKIYPVGERAPKMRFRLMTFRELHDENRFWSRALKVAADRYNLGVKPGALERVRFVHKRGNAIPAC